MYRILIVSLFAAGFLFAGCKSENTGRRHEGCYRSGSHRVGRNNGRIHHHYAKPVEPDAVRTTR
ncbi:MAG: hypothetical protein IJG18_12725 [Kiritimatiellae bacterium]|nr:hypothetical protein [Kiritimatiellia bacterium]